MDTCVKCYGETKLGDHREVTLNLATRQWGVSGDLQETSFNGTQGSETSWGAERRMRDEQAEAAGSAGSAGRGKNT